MFNLILQLTYKNQSPVEEYIFAKQIELENIEDVQQKKEAQENIEIDKAISAAIDEIVHKPQQKTVPAFNGFMPFNASHQREEKQALVISKTEDLNKEEVMEEVAQKVAKTMIASQISMFDETTELIIEKVKLHYSPIVQQKIKSTIDIPDIAMIPKNEVTYQYKDFNLNMQNVNFAPVSEDIMLESLKDNAVSKVKFETEQVEKPEQFIIGELILKSKINYKTAKSILYKLIEQVRQHLSKQYNEQEVDSIFQFRKKDIADIIYKQMTYSNHFVIEPPTFEVKVLNPVLPILKHNYSKYKEDEILDYHTSIPVGEVPKRVFGGFKKACHTEYEFDSEPELEFALLAERDETILKWLRPAPKQFKIWWRGGQSYEPDFVVETADTIFIVEIKASNRMEDEEVLLKAKAAYAFCEHISATLPDVKKWRYMLLSELEVSRNTTFDYLVKEVQWYGYHQNHKTTVKND